MSDNKFIPYMYKRLKGDEDDDESNENELVASSFTSSIKRTFLILLSIMLLVYVIGLRSFREYKQDELKLGHRKSYNQMSHHLHIGNVPFSYVITIPNINLSLITQNETISKHRLIRFLNGVTSVQHDQQSQENSSNKIQPLFSDSYHDRIKRLRYYCDKYQLENKSFTYKRKSSNRRKDGDSKFCSTRNCPMIVDENNKMLLCFVQKVASTSLKNLFVDMSGQKIESSLNSNVTAFHIEANQMLVRVSPMYYKKTQMNNQFYKIIFVRHPFKRLVSAFEDKANKSRSDESYFYARYWDKVMIEVRGKDNVDNTSRPTFAEFVHLLVTTHPFTYDEHWAPYWLRCEPCYIKYDFVGKLETSEMDLSYLYRKNSSSNGKSLKQDYPYIWANKNNRIKLENLKIKNYFMLLSPDEIIKLYQIYFLDFKLFGYTLEEIFDYD